MAEINLRNFERAEFDGNTLTLAFVDAAGAPVSLAMAMPQYAAMTTDVAFALLNTTPPHPNQLIVTKATDVGLVLEALTNDPILVFRHGQGQQSAFLVPASKLAALLQSAAEKSQQDPVAKN